MSDFNRIRTTGCFTPAAACSAAVSSPCKSCPTPGKEDCACCKRSLRDALKLLCSNCISDLVDYDSFAFFTASSVVGAIPAGLTPTDSDNLGELTGSFRRFSPCNLDLIDISGTVLTPFGSTVTVNSASLCSLSAIAFQLLPPDGGTIPDGCCPDTAFTRYRRVRDLLQAELVCTSRPCGECTANCQVTEDCCCSEGILAALSMMSMNQRTTLSAGLLALQNVTTLGTIGNVLVLGSEAESRFYFVCANKVDFLA